MSVLTKAPAKAVDVAPDEVHVSEELAEPARNWARPRPPERTPAAEREREEARQTVRFDRD